MEGLINAQKGIHNTIERGLTNFKKSPKDRLTYEYIDTRLDNLEKDWDLFRKNNSKLYEISNPDELCTSDYVKLEMYEVTEETYLNYKCQLKALLKQIALVTTQVNTNRDSMQGSCSPLVKLPKITIPIFSGKYAEWTTFRDLFIALVHKNTSLTDVQKLHYLKTHISGEAEQLIRHTPITEANYLHCWSQLEKRYDNKRYLSNCILKRLFSQKRIITESSVALKELLDTTIDCLNGLKNLGIDVATWDIIIIHVLTYKLDIETRKQWELNVSNNSCNELPTLEEFKLFLENRFRAFECLESKKAPAAISGYTQNQSKSFLATNNNNPLSCEFCSETHKLCFCKLFAKQGIDFRREFVSKKKLCFNCLGRNHTVYECNKNVSCRLCNKRHHSLLHQGASNEAPEHTAVNNLNTIDEPDPFTEPNSLVSCLATNKVKRLRQVVLATALIKAKSITGELQTVRALIDQGSQACFITEAMVQYLRLRKIPINGTVSGIGNNKTIHTKYAVYLLIQSRINPEFTLNLKAYVITNITSYIPEKTLDPLDWIEINTLSLADPHFDKPNKIDMLLGADVYSTIIKEGLKRSPSKTLVAQDTTLGWIISGSVSTSSNIVKESNAEIVKINVMHTQINNDEMLKKFWEIEERDSSKKILTYEEQKCEEIYNQTTKRSPDGRYIVKLPFREDTQKFKAGGSREIAERRLKSLEKRLSKNSTLQEEYHKVMNEYLTLGHMRLVRKNDNKKDEAVYLPHHAVIRNDKTTSKVRVVFNASEKNLKGISLNDMLMTGPTLQADLRHIVMKWRKYPIAIVADIIKMYRQIKVSEEDVIFQRILWRSSPEEDINDYELLTVTFGTAAAPFLAVRTLHQVAYDEKEKYPLAAEKVLNCFYMDDLMTGCYSVDEGIELYKQITGLLNKGGFTLQKWNSNNTKLLEKIKLRTDERTEETTNENINDNKYNITNDSILKEDINHLSVKSQEDTNIKILGLTWNRRNDSFQYTVNLSPSIFPVTKRTILADISRLFDPLGWIAPSIILAKTFIQRLWLTGLGWDEVLPDRLINEWLTYRSELQQLTKIQIPRWIKLTSKDKVIELHGFCDASNLAYSAVVYVRIVDSDNNIHVSLLTSRTRVAPIKQISIPKLELCGAVLLSKLLDETSEVLDISKINVKAWTDSTVVLGWLNSHPSRWKTFVANRVSEILTCLESSQWFHVTSKENPADCASRGVSPALLSNNSLWFAGPEFLRKPYIVYNKPKNLDITIEQSVKSCIITHTQEDIFANFSSFKKMLRVIAYCRRFRKQGNLERTLYIQKTELDAALVCCIKKAQRDEFETEYKQLEEKGLIETKTSKLKSLCPYIDKNGIMRVTGRLHKAQLEETTKHPIVLPNSSRFTKLLIADAHITTMHGGPQIMLNFLRSAYWIIGAKNLIKQHAHKCITCIKLNAKFRTQLMGSLPSVRCTPARPFLHSGVDYAGPINIKTTKGRGHRAYKGYICLFVCMATRAVHLEAVSDMTTQAFLAAFRRFVSRRGRCSQLWSDNGTTFVGAEKELKQLASIQTSLAENLEANGTSWHFIPPHAPNFGGIWEAGIKSAKYHLKRTIGDACLTFEELSTLLSQIEACLNSRPINIISNSDPSELLPLTPGHFLIGEPLVAVPDYNFENSNINSLTRWQFVQKNLQSFWSRWSKEYLNKFLNRSKWTTKLPEPNIGDVVIIKDNNLPPGRWSLGRIIDKHPGHDGITRVVTLRTKSSVISRPTSKICILPLDE